MFEFWLKNEKEGVSLLLPVTPEGYETEVGIDIETVRATEIGDLNLTGHRKPESIVLEGFFTTKEYDFRNRVTVPVQTAMDYVRLLVRWCKEKALVRLVIADEEGAKINAVFHIESIKYGQKKEDNGDITYTLHLREHTPMQTAIVQKNDKTGNGTRPKGETKKPKEYVVKKGDCLYNIARKVYGNPNQWRKIYEANKGVIGKNPNLIFPGQKYRIP